MDASCFISSGDQFNFSISNGLNSGLPEVAAFVQIFGLVFEYLVKGWKKRVESNTVC